ncbi:Peptidoglycan glycosyltransferase MrdB [wastewater metagenome]|uniref:Peptidoglycan glycosyltransferase MrdB n=2 Tax=unclassified sequences TaxID=12908 RepID=A0A5B8R7K8_9ZZZZ|nr:MULTISPECIES: rod shape-determining protein RodA [Arhodomonas]QEA03893.1 peptidoglycan glycosyltransferase MrdB [uncultured organism]
MNDDVVGPARDRSFVQRYLHLDMPLLVLLALVAAGGLVVLYSAFNGDFEAWERQCWRLGVAFFVMLVLAQVPPSLLRRWTPLLYLAGVASLLAVMLFGTSAGGARRWIDLGVMMVQPSEFMKLALPMMVAWVLAREDVPPRVPVILVVVAVIGVPVGLIAVQPDLGTALLVAAAGVFALFLGGLSWRYIAGGAVLAGAAAPLLWFFGMRDYQRQRVLTFLDPERDPLGAGYHIIQSKIAIGSGGVYGKGWMAGTQSHLEFLPERHTDFIFAVLSEEFGFFGVCVLLVLYMAVVGRGLWIAGHAQDRYSRLLAGSISLTFFVYFFTNIGMVSGLLPVVGLPLPLVSFGGTSMVTLMAGFGILMSIQTHRRLWSS